MSALKIVRRFGELYLSRSPAFAAIQARFTLTKRTTDGPLPVPAYRFEGSALVLPAGALREVRAMFPGADVEDERPTFERKPFTAPTPPSLNEYQRAACNAVWRERGGILVAPTGAGKTRMLAALVAQFKMDALVIGPTREICDQLRADLAEATGEAIGDAHSSARVVVATVAAFPSPDREALRRFGVVVVDEAHRAAAPSYLRLLACLSCRFRIGVTATPMRADGLWPLVPWALGPVVYRVSLGDLEAESRLVVPAYEQRATAFVPSRGASCNDWSALTREIANDAARNALIVGVAEEAAVGGAVLVVVGQVDQADRLAAACRANGYRAEALHGRRTPRDRGRIVSEARAGSLQILIGTQVADEGLDIPNLSTLVLASASKAEGRLLQRVGRILRPLPGKQAPRVIDLVDEGSNVLAHQATRRKRAFEATFGTASGEGNADV